MLMSLFSFYVMSDLDVWAYMVVDMANVNITSLSEEASFSSSSLSCAGASDSRNCIIESLESAC